MKKMLMVVCIPLLFACGGKKEEKTKTPPPAADNPPAGIQNKPAEVKQEVNDALQMREEENERRLKEAVP